MFKLGFPDFFAETVKLLWMSFFVLSSPHIVARYLDDVEDSEVTSRHIPDLTIYLRQIPLDGSYVGRCRYREIE
jgi:hypothetical protein